METKQSAMDWLKSELHRQCMFDGFAWEDRNYFMKLLDQAKEMEKQQIIDAAYHGVDYEHSPFDNAEQYYNDTYGKV